MSTIQTLPLDKRGSFVPIALFPSRLLPFLMTVHALLDLSTVGMLISDGA